MRSFLKVIGLVALSSILFSLAHPSAPPVIATREGLVLNTAWQEILAWFGMVPLLIALYELRGLKAWAASFFFALVYFMISFYWINIAIMVYGGVSPVASIATELLLSTCMGLQLSFGIYFGFYAHRRFGLKLWVSLPISFVAWELLRNYCFTGFPWQNPAYSQYLNPPILQTASIWGVYGIAYIIVLCNTVLFELILWLKKRDQIPFPKTGLICLAALLLFSLAYGYYRIDSNEEIEKTAPKLRAALLQGNIDQHLKNASRNHAMNIMKIYTGLAAQIPDDIDLVIWPEAAFPYNVPHDIKYFGRLLRKTWPKGAPWPMLIGCSNFSRKGGENVYYNSAYLIDRNFKVLGAFDKSHLVPFGEYVPLKEFIKINKVVPSAGMFEPGELGQGLRIGDSRFGVLICYEGIFPEIAKEYAGVGVDFLVNLTNDAWYGVSSAPYQHLAFYSFRAVETQKAILRAANTGFTAVIDSSGGIVKKTALFERTALMAEIPLIRKRTIYSYIGEAPAWVCLFFFMYWALRGVWGKRSDAAAGK